MCGIAGYIDLRGQPAEDAKLTAMARELAHRGPQGSGIWRHAHVGLAHRRLAVVDLTDAAAQPMTDVERGLTLVYNGEIYNYRELRDELMALGHVFTSSGDAEVVLRAWAQWGPECLPRFNGMWALALWERDRRRLWLSRDRFGVKPLHIVYRPGILWAFASEVKALLAAFPDLAKPNDEALAHFLEMGALDWDDRTFFADVKNFPAGHVGFIAGDMPMAPRRFWRPDVRSAQPTDDLVRPVETFRKLFVDSVRLRLRADVEIGTCLSGGLDSSSIVSVARKLLGHPRMHAFSSLHAEREANEESYVQAVVDDVGLVLHAVRPHSAALIRDLPRLIWHQEKPASLPSLYSQWEVMREASRHVRVLLDGQGADELLGGYLWYFTPYLVSEWRRWRATGNPLVLARLLVSYPIMRWISGQPHLWHLLRGRMPLAAIDRVARMCSKRGNLPSIVAPALAVRYRSALRWPEPTRVTGDPLLDTLHHQFFAVGLPTLLHLEDRNSMAHSVEARLPFTDDHRLVDFCMSLPVHWRIRGYSTKHILRRAMAGTLIERVRRRRRKLGFTTPLASWLRRDESLVAQWRRVDFSGRPYLNAAGVRTLLDQHVHGQADHSEALFRALTLEIWCRVFLDGESPRLVGREQGA